MINDIHKAYTMHEVDDLYLQTEKKKNGADTAILLLEKTASVPHYPHDTKLIVGPWVAAKARQTETEQVHQSEINNLWSEHTLSMTALVITRYWKIP